MAPLRPLPASLFLVFIANCRPNAHAIFPCCAPAAHVYHGKATYYPGPGLRPALDRTARTRTCMHQYSKSALNKTTASV
eukprot:3635248-Pyramimonas_sp.AAC.1